MPTFQFKKLVRDNIAKWHVESGHTLQISVLKGQQLNVALCEKLHEEADEVAATISRDELIEEIADVQQVIDALCEHNNISNDELTQVKREKAAKKGAFTKGIYIDSVYMPDEDDKWVAYCRKNPEKYPEV